MWRTTFDLYQSNTTTTNTSTVNTKLLRNLFPFVRLLARFTTLTKTTTLHNNNDNNKPQCTCIALSSFWISILLHLKAPVCLFITNQRRNYWFVFFCFVFASLQSQATTTTTTTSTTIDWLLCVALKRHSRKLNCDVPGQLSIDYLFSDASSKRDYNVVVVVVVIVKLSVWAQNKHLRCRELNRRCQLSVGVIDDLFSCGCIDEIVAASI